ncbi:MAG: vWA domain-containing protein [Pirellulales bacterium]
MLRPVTFCAAILALSAIVTFALADDSKIVITVKRPKPAVEVPATPPFQGQRPSVDVALLLDTSNSMDGLISQAKRQLWTIVQQFSKAKKDGQTPVLRVALFEYGNTRLPASEGFIRQVVALTDDLDKLSEALFALSTSGGDEYCGQVIDEAITRLDWSKENGGYKAIFIAGNEPFTQGTVDYHKACKRAIEKGIVVNTIHCGTSSAGLDGKWQHAAQLAEGESFNIDQDRAVVEVKCPQDEIIIKLNSDLNGTYLWYGKAEVRQRFAENQVAQDANAIAAGEGVAAGRVVVKAGSGYSNRNRDLVDSLKEDEEILKKLPREDLPDALKDLTPEKREAHVREVAARRAGIQKQINDLAAEREAYLDKVRAQQGSPASDDTTLGSAVSKAVSRQLANSGFEIGAIGK